MKNIAAGVRTPNALGAVMDEPGKGGLGAGQTGLCQAVFSRTVTNPCRDPLRSQEMTRERFNMGSGQRLCPRGAKAGENERPTR